MNKLLKALTAGLVCLGSVFPSFAEETAGPLPCTLTAENGAAVWQLGDQNRSTKLDWTGGVLTVDSEEPMTGLYLVWDRPPEAWTGSAGSQTFSGGEYGFLHEYISLGTPVTHAELTLPEGARCCDVYAFGAGELPDWVQQWQPPLEDADLLVLPTHADDEHLFFGGTMPYYAGQLQKKVQVVYFTNHWAEPYRPHELLDGLWTVGIRNYPVMSSFVDQYADSLDYARTLYDEDEAVAWQVEQLRRFKPEVVVGHDVNGEYGHGVHMYNADTLRQALELSADSAFCPESAQEWGVWDVPKTYLHLWPENPIVMDWSQPLSAFGGRTAVEMARLGFAEHVSQQTFFKVEDYGPYDCRKFGLYRSLVGPDTQGGDFFENIGTEDYSDYIPPEPEPEPEPAPEPEPERAQSLPGWVLPAGLGSAAVLTAGVILYKRRRQR